jgi:hypothetical protein
MAVARLLREYFQIPENVGTNERRVHETGLAWDCFYSGVWLVLDEESGSHTSADGEF